jgi:hypothetical protein
MQISLAALLAERGRLSAGQIVTVGVAIARELAGLHASGHVYASLTAEAVVIDGDGRPTLAPPTIGGGQPIDDMRALVAVLRTAAGPDAGLGLLRVLGTPVDADSFARELFAVTPAQPLLSAPLPAAPRARRRPAAGLRPFILVTAAVVVAGFAGVASARSGGHRATAVAPRPTPVVTRSAVPRFDWRDIVVALDAARDDAVNRGDAGALQRVYVSDSSALDRELRNVRSLHAHHARAVGVHLVVDSVTVRSTTASMTVLRVVDRLLPYDIVLPDGKRIHDAGRPAREWTVTLRRVRGGWRIASVH